MISFAQRKFYENILRRVPNFISNSIIDIINPFRKNDVIKKINPRWITLFITNYCSARCEHCFYSKELNNKIEELNLENLKKIFLSLKKPLNTLRITGGEPFLNKSTEDFFILYTNPRLCTNRKQINHRRNTHRELYIYCKQGNPTCSVEIFWGSYIT